MSDLLEDAKSVNIKNPYSLYNNIEIARVEPDFAELYVDMNENMTNLYHTLHGGAYFVLADCCSGAAVRTNGKHYVTQQASVSYMRSIKSGRITARCNVIFRGKASCISEVSIFDEEGTLCFKGTFTSFCIDRSPGSFAD